MTLFIRLLGPVDIRNNEQSITIKGYKPLALLAYLLVTGQAHTRQQLVDLLYDESDDPRRSLRWTLNQLRQAIGPAYIVADRQQIGFNFENDYWCDVEALLRGELDCYGGEFLEGLYVKDAHRFLDWAFYQRERLRTHYQEILIEQLAAEENKGHYKAVVDLGHNLVQLDNLCEAGYRALMQAYALLGNQEAALAQYEACCQVLSDELGLELEPETQALYAQIQAGSLTDPRSLADLPVQLPDFLKRDEDAHEEQRPIFVAREGELVRLDQLLQQTLAGQGQVVFIIGGAGRGKTALLNAFAAWAQATCPELLVADGHCDLYLGLGDPYLPFRDILGMLSGDVAPHLAAGRISFEQARRLWHNVLPACQALLEQGQHLIDVLVARKALRSRAQRAAPTGARQLRALAELKEASPGEVTQENLFQQMTNVLRALADRQPLLLMLDDLQWADASSVSLLFHLSRRLAGS